MSVFSRFQSSSMQKILFSILQINVNSKFCIQSFRRNIQNKPAVWKAQRYRHLLTRTGPLFALGLTIQYRSLSSVLPSSFKRVYCSEFNLQGNCENKWNRVEPSNTFLLTLVIRKIWRFCCRLIRCIVVAIIFTPFLLTYPLTYISDIFTHYWWLKLLRAIEISGPVLVKFGQWAATRKDIFSERMCKYLARLQHQRHPHSWRQTEEQLDKNFGSDWRRYLSLENGEQRPVGSGCVAQVYKMVLNLDELQRGFPDSIWNPSRMKDDEVCITVALKVLHPGIREDFFRDISIISFFAETFQFLFPSLKWLDLTGCIDNFAEFMMDQIDLRQEAKMLEIFNKNFEDNPNIVFPTPIYPFICHDTILESWEDGCLISVLVDDKIDLKLKTETGKCLIHTLLKMAFKDNIVHGDLHPGNILFRKADIISEEPYTCKVFTPFEGIATVDFGENPRPPQFQLAILDCGLTTKLSPKDFDNLVEVFRAVVLDQGKKVAEVFLKHSYNQCENEESFKVDMEKLVHDFRTGTLSLSRVDVGDLLGRVFSLLVTHRIRLESNYSAIMLAIMVLEGLGRSLDPALDLIREARPYLLS